jgi:hypothetical protein
MTPNELVGWLQDLKDSQQLVEKAASTAGFNEAVKHRDRRNRPPQVTRLDDRTFRTNSVVNRARIQEQMYQATSAELKKRLDTPP